MIRLSRFARPGRMLRWSCSAGNTTSTRLTSFGRRSTSPWLDCDHLIVDLSATEFIDASTIGVLMEARQHAIELDRTFSVVLGTAPIVEQILEVSGVLPLLNVVPTVERALDALASSAAPADLATHADQ